MFSRILRQALYSGRLSRTVHFNKFNPVAVKLCNYITISDDARNYSLNSNTPIIISNRLYSDDKCELTEGQFLVVCEETLQSLYEVFEEVADEYLSDISEADVMYEGGILKIDLGKHGIYVINRQTPNKQIWLSSPISGPKRYDYVNDGDSGHWIYKHDGVTLHKLLQTEMKQILSRDIDFSKCLFSKL